MTKKLNGYAGLFVLATSIGITQPSIAMEVVLKTTAKCIIHQQVNSVVHNITGLDLSLSDFILTSVTCGIPQAVGGFCIGRIVGYISSNWFHTQPSWIPKVLDCTLPKKEFIGAFSRFCNYCRDLKKSDIQQAIFSHSKSRLCELLAEESSLAKQLEKQPISEKYLNNHLLNPAMENVIISIFYRIFYEGFPKKHYRSFQNMIFFHNKPSKDCSPMKHHGLQMKP